MAEKKSILIIGGGVIGAWSAYFLRKAGYGVTIVEKGDFGSGCSSGNCGLIVPSHALPLCVPDALFKPFKSMLDASSPFYVNPMVGPSLWSWMIRFALNCTHRKSMAAAESRHRLLQSSKSLLEDMIQKENLSIEYQKNGLLFVHTKDESLSHYSKINKLLTQEFSLSAKLYDSKGVVELEPALKESVVGGWHYEGDAHLRPDHLMAELKRVLTSMGVVLLENQDVKDFVLESGSISAIKTASEDLVADTVVLATGALSPILARRLGVKLHIQPGKGYSITTDQPDPCPKIPLILEDHAVAVTPFKNGFRLGSTMEFGGYNEEINPKRLGLLEEGARHYLRDVRGKNIQETWYGWRPMSHNGIPTISSVPGFKNAWVATGHSMLGISMGTGTGKLLSELISGESPHIDPTPYQL